MSSASIHPHLAQDESVHWCEYEQPEVGEAVHAALGSPSLPSNTPLSDQTATRGLERWALKIRHPPKYAAWLHLTAGKVELEVTPESDGYALLSEASHVLTMIPGLKSFHEPMATIQTKKTHGAMTLLTHEPDAKTRCSGIQSKFEQAQLATEELVQPR